VEGHPGQPKPQAAYGGWHGRGGVHGRGGPRLFDFLRDIAI